MPTVVSQHVHLLGLLGISKNFLAKLQQNFLELNGKRGLQSQVGK